MKIAVIGAGLGGLAVSCLLATDGHSIDVFEKNAQPGGKMNEVSVDGFRFDTGPSLLTMPFVLEQLFDSCYHKLSDYLELIPMEPLCRYFYPSGTIFDAYSDLPKTLKQIETFAPEDRQAYIDFLYYSETLYRRTAPAFLFNPLQSWSELFGLNMLDLFKIDALKTVGERIDKNIKSPELQQFFKRFTTYNGSSPFKAPATLNVIPHVELNLGGYYVKGGIYQIAKALYKLAQTLGVRFHFHTEVENITLNEGSVDGVQLKGNGEVKPYDIIISNSDASDTYLNLLPDGVVPDRKRKKIKNMEPSCSGFVILLGIKKKFDQIRHHNIFFSSDYEREFRQIFDEHRMPDDPTIYIANTSYNDPDHAPARSSNFFILVNAPYNNGRIDWEKEKARIADLILSRLESKGLEGLKKAINVQEIITPEDFEQWFHSNKGSIYGTSSNSRLAAFARPKNKSPYVKGLYLVGGSTHPGGGIPLVTLSAMHTYSLIRKDNK